MTVVSAVAQPAAATFTTTTAGAVVVPSPRVVDVVVYGGPHYDAVLELRMRELNATVGLFVVVQHARPNGAVWPRFAPFAHKIVHVWAGVHCPDWFWVCEDYQREMLLDGFLRAGGTDDDVTWSDTSLGMTTRSRFSGAGM